MSILSQFFPSGGGREKIKTNMLLVGGGSGGRPAGGGSCPTVVCNNFGSGGGGGGAGQVYQFFKYEIEPSTEISVTIGGGGATSSNGGNSSICICNEQNFTARGGITGSPSRSDEFFLEDSYGHGGGGGATGQVNWNPTPCPGTVPGPCGNVPSVTNCGSCFNCTLIPSSCITGASIKVSSSSLDNNFIIKNVGERGGAACSPSYGYCPPASSPFPILLSPEYFTGVGGGGGGGSFGIGNAGLCKNPGFQSPVGGPPAAPCVNTCGGGGDGGGGGSGTVPLLFCNLICCVAQGGGGGGGNFGVLTPTPTLDRPSVSYPLVRGTGGSSSTGGCGGDGGNMGSPYYPQVPVQPAGCPGCNGTNNLGGGGGGGGAGPTTQGTGGNGGSGVVVIQYPTVYSAVSAPARPGSTDCSPSTPGYYTYRYDGPGSITLP